MLECNLVDLVKSCKTFLKMIEVIVSKYYSFPDRHQLVFSKKGGTMKNIIFTFVLCLLIQGIVSAETTMKLVPQVLKGQKIITQENSEAVVSHKKSSAALRPPPDGYSLEARPMILVSVYVAAKPYDFSTEDIQIFVDDKPHKIFTRDEFVEEIKQRQANEIKTVESKYDALIRDAAQNAYTPSSSAEVETPSLTNKNTVGSMSSGGVTYDVSSVARSQSQINTKMQAEKDAIEKRTAQEIAVTDSILLKKTTVSPDTWYRGYIALEKIPDPAQSHVVKITVSVAGEKHEFLFNHLEAQE